MARPCLDCGRLATATRCVFCEAKRQRQRNASRPQYAGAWDRVSRQARRAQPWCSVCGATEKLSLDHERGQVECVSCNSAHRRDA